MGKQNDQLIIVLGVVLGVIIFTLSFGATVYFQNIQLNYDITKCNNLQKTQSAYEFTNNIEINAEYNERCYYLNNHPMVELNEIYGPAFFGGIMSVIFVIMLMMLIKLMTCEPYDGYGSW